MNRSEQQLLLSELRQRRIMSADQALPAETGQEPPWYVVAMAGFAAWLAALLLWAAWAMTNLGDLPLLNLLVAMVLLLVAVRLLRSAGDFTAQLGLALSLFGQGLLVFFMSELQPLDPEGVRLPALVALLVASAMLLMRAGSAHRFLCALVAMVALVWLVESRAMLSLYAVLLPALAVGLWLARSRWAGGGRAPIIRALAGATTLVALILGALTEPSAAGIVWGGIRSTRSELAWLYPLGSASLLLVTAVWLSRSMVMRRRLECLLGALAAAALGSLAPGLLIAAALWLAVFHACDRLWCVLVGVGVAFYLGDLYYSLHITLLVKSVLLATGGVLLLAVRQFVVVPLRRAQ